MEDEVKRSHSLSHAIFVYGTLKRGQSNYHYLQKFGNHQFFGTGWTVLKYPLIIDLRSNLPFLLDAPGEGQVCGILVTNALLFQFLHSRILADKHRFIGNFLSHFIIHCVRKKKHPLTFSFISL